MKDVKVKRGVLCLVGSLPMLALGLACNGNVPSPAQAEGVKEAVRAAGVVRTVRPVRHTFTYKIEGPGEIQADEVTPMFAKISGYVQKINKDIGDVVKEGEIIAELSVPDMDAELLQKEDAGRASQSRIGAGGQTL